MHRAHYSLNNTVGAGIVNDLADNMFIGNHYVYFILITQHGIGKFHFFHNASDALH